MDAARQVALNWAFLMDTLDMTFDELYPLFEAWCKGLPDDKMADIMASAEALSDAAEDTSEGLHTADDIWGDLDVVEKLGTWIEENPVGLDPWPIKKRPKAGPDDAPDGTWVEDVPTPPTPPRPLGSKGPSAN